MASNDDLTAAGLDFTTPDVDLAPPVGAQQESAEQDSAEQDRAEQDSAESSGAEPPVEPEPGPGKKAARKRATRSKAAPSDVTAAAGRDIDADADAAVEDVSAVAADVPVRRAARKRATRADLPAAPGDTDAGHPGAGDMATSDTEAGVTGTSEGAGEGADSPAGPAATLGVLFQAPAVGSGRASAPSVAARTTPPAADAVTAEGDKQADEEDTADQPSEGPRRRRRRGGKGRRARATDSEPGEEHADGDTTGEGDGEDSADAEPGEEAEVEAGTRRRTRRRRRSGSGGDGDEAPGVTLRVRESRRDEVTGVRGSTRLEAKKQRRREGREAGRRRTVITEAEFLARRESVERVMVVRTKGDRTQIGVLEDGVLVEHYISRETNVSMAGNIYLGRVQNVLPSMEAAFVDIGKGRNAVLYAGEVNWDVAGLEANQPKRIENALSSGESVLVQVTKDPIGHKGARLTSQISLPGRYLVYVPNSSMTGISRKLPDTERARLKGILKEVVPESAGVIVRTAAEGASEEELRADVQRLTRTWEDIQAKAESAGGSGKGRGKGGATAPVLLHGEPDLTVRVIRDIFNEDFSSLVVAGEQAWQEVSDYVDAVAPDLAARITRWTREDDLFTHYRIDEQIAKAMDRKVWLPSGGSLVIDRTEAMTVIDVNTGKFIGSGGNLEETVTKNNIEAAEEIVRQLRLRDVGGIIVIDFIDMVLEANRDLVVRRLLECLGRDRTKHQVAEVTSLGLVQMTRKRVGSGLIEVFSETCERCNGRGVIVHADPVDRFAADPGGSGGAPPARSASGRGPRRGRAPEPLASAPRPSGPTPAQIAAAAHAAALKTAEHATTSDEAHPVPQQPASSSDDRSAAQTTSTEAHGEPEPPSEPAGEPSLEPAGEPAPESAGQASLQPAGEPRPEATNEPRPEPAAEAPEPVPPHAGRGRRRHGRVVAPAGPPRLADLGPAGSLAPEAAGE